MFYTLLTVHMVVQVGLIAMVALFGVFLYRHTGLWSAIWMSLYLTAGFFVSLFQPTLTKGWFDPLVQLWQSGYDLPWTAASIGELQARVSYAFTIPLKVASLLVTALVLADGIRLLKQAGIHTESKVCARLLSINNHHAVWGAAMMFCIGLTPVLNMTTAYYLTTLVGN